MYQLITTGCPSGYGFVRDYMGNKIFYGPISECHDCIDELMGWGPVKRTAKKKGGQKDGSSESNRH